MKKSICQCIYPLWALLCALPLAAQEGPPSNWPAECRQVSIRSTFDGEQQPAYFYKAKGALPRPLIVSLHSWSGDYTQKDTLAWMCINNNYHYIHPDFRGINNRPEACGSPAAIQDMDDAIAFAIEQGGVDTSEIHVVGVSGGGYATLLAYMNSKYNIRTFSAWVPISNLVDWYYESVGRKQKYARDLAQVTKPAQAGPEDYQLNETEARKRSPIFMPTPVGRRQNAKLFLYTGIHDGYTGSVPITQSMKFYNKVVRDMAAADSSALITTEQMLSLLERRNSGFANSGELKKGMVHFQKKYQDKVQLTIFEGTHEMLPDLALQQVQPLKVLAIGDSNGALESGWVNQLRQLHFTDRIYNTCISGNTIGFDNLGRRELNTLRNLDRYLTEGTRQLNGLDKIVILLGTNDCKAVFDDSLSLVPQNLEKLIGRIKDHEAYREYKPGIYIVSPPPYAPDAQLIPKYHGGAADIAWLFPRFKEVAHRNGCTFIDIYSGLLPKWSEVSKDGIHVEPDGQRWIAEQISRDWQTSDDRNSGQND